MKINLLKHKQDHQAEGVIDLRQLIDEKGAIEAIVNCTPLLNYKTGNSQSSDHIDFLIPEGLDHQRMRAVSEGILYAKEIAALPPNLFPPLKLAQKLNELSTRGIEIEILDANQLKEIGMGALLAAGQGSEQQPAVAILKWPGKHKDIPPIALIGKGVVFDSGGICLKEPAHQKPMKMDKSGAGVVAGAMKALAELNCPYPIIGILGFLENMPDGKAIKPGDVITTFSSKTVEIVDTDAEGRLLLADCLSYANRRFSPSIMIDIGTLTKETAASLGDRCAGLYANDDQLCAQLMEASKCSGEALWPLPMGPYFAKQIESPIADLQNSGLDGCGENGACAEFLKAFVGTTRWAHIDLSRAAWNEKGPTGFFVHCLVTWVEKLASRISFPRL